MAVKKKRSVEELEELLQNSERIRKEHLAYRRDQLALLRSERAVRFNQFVQMISPVELERLVTDTIKSDQGLVDKSVAAVQEAIRKGEYGFPRMLRRGTPSGVFSVRPSDDDAIKHEFQYVYDAIQRFGQTHHQLVELFIERILNRKETMDAIDSEDLQKIARVYYPYRRNFETYTGDIERVRQVLRQGNIESLVVKQRPIDPDTNAKINYYMQSATEFVDVAQKSLITIMSESSVAKSEQIMSINSKINW
jgi:hypothetical protein